MRRKISKITTPLHTFRANLKKSPLAFLPRDATLGTIYDVDTPQAAPNSEGAPAPGNNGGRQAPESQEGHFVQTRHPQRQWPANKKRQPLDEDTLRAIAECAYRHALEDGDEIAELTPWELKVVSHYAAKYEKPADEALWFVLTNREDVHYIAEEVGLAPQTSNDGPPS